MRERRRLMKLLVATLLVGAGLAIVLCLSWALTRGSASASNGLACSVRANSCVGGEVEVFRMSSTGNAHAAAASDPTFTQLVCCGGVTGLGTSCSGTYDTVLRLSKVDYNAHVQATGSYPTEVCLSAGTAVVQCMFASSCPGYACLATASGADNAHVADCNGVDDYATKLCCFAGAALPTPVPVGGIAELPEASGSSGPNYVVLAGLAAAVVAALGAGAWYARRRWGR